MAKFNLDEFEFEKPERATKKSTVKKAEPKAETNPVKSASTPTAKTQNTGAKMPMMNIRFSPENYDYMRREAAIRGLSVIKFTNWIIDQYRQDPNHVHVNDLYLNEENW